MASKAISYPSWILRAERIYEVIPIKKNTCEFRTWETFGGLLAFYARHFAYAIIEEAGRRSAENLKGFVENITEAETTDSLLYH